MKTRIISALIGTPILCAIILSKNLYVIGIAILAIILIALKEFYKSFSNVSILVQLFSMIFSTIYITLLTLKVNVNMDIFLIIFVLCMALLLLLDNKNTNILNVTIGLFGFFYICFNLSRILLLIQRGAYGFYFLWIIFITAWGSDTGAYFIGKKYGKYKPWPSISPGKTLEGAIAGLMSSVILSTIYGYILCNISNINMKYIPFFTMCGIAGAVFGQAGDLIASAIKRFNKVKDYGNLIPGHGGILDRFDSIIVNASCIYLLFLLFMRFQ